MRREQGILAIRLRAGYSPRDCGGLSPDPTMNRREQFEFEPDDCWGPFTFENNRCVKRSLHVIPVPDGMTAEDAWAEIKIMGELVDYDPNRDCTWAVIEVLDL